MKRQAHILETGKSKERPSNLVYFDSESKVIDDVHNPYLICACFSLYKKERGKYTATWKDYHTDNDFMEQFWDDVNHRCKKKKALTIINHNIGYDMIVTKAIPSLGKYGFRVISFFEKGMVFIMKMKDDIGRVISFVSSTNYYSFPLKEIGNILKLEKLDYDYINVNMEKAIIYCRRDVEIVKLAMETFYKFVDDNELGCIAKTISGQAFNAFRFRFMGYEICIHDQDRANTLERESYCGGRVECWRLGEQKADQMYYYVDVNSMYPYVMKEFNYPVELQSHNKYNSIEEITKEINKGNGVIARVLINTDRPYFPYRTKDKLIFPIGEFKTTLATPELKFALDNNLIVEVYEANYYTMINIFTDYVNFFYENRLLAKALGDKVHDVMFKLFLNGLYGKFGQLAENFELDGESEDIYEISCDYEFDADLGKKVQVKTFGGNRFIKTGEDEAFNSFPAIASHVTSNARMHLISFIIKAGFDNVLYMDTDSLFINEAGYKNLESSCSNSILGAIKLETTSNEVVINAPKNYKFGKIKKSKGIKNNKYTVNFKTKDAQIMDYNILIDRELTPEEIESHLEKLFDDVTDIVQQEGFISVKKLSEQDYIIQQFPKMASFIREGNLSVFKNKWVKKHLSNNYTKGVVDDVGKVTPHRMV